MPKPFFCLAIGVDALDATGEALLLRNVEWRLDVEATPSASANLTASALAAAVSIGSSVVLLGPDSPFGSSLLL